MSKFILVIAMCLLSVSTLFGQQIKIAPEHRVKQTGNGYCAHCAIETIARHYGFKEVAGRVARLHARWGDNGGGVPSIEHMGYALQNYNIAYYILPTDEESYDSKWFNFACKNGFACIVGVRLSPTSAHAMVLVGYYDDRVAFVDCEYVDRIVWMQRDDFDCRLMGAIMVYPWRATKTIQCR